MHRPFNRGPVAMSLFVVLGSTASAATLDERLAAQGERLVPGQIVDRSANRLWTLLVTPSVDVDAVAATGATVDWAWPERGVMVVRGADPRLGDALRLVPGVRAAEPATTPATVATTRTASASGADTSVPWPTGPDIYRENGQWPLYAIDAVDPEPAPDTVSGWAPGEWKLAYDGQGVTVGGVDTGGPTLWCDPVDVRVDLALPAWGACALFGATEQDGVCVAPDAALGDPETLCAALGDIAGGLASLDGDTCRLDDVGLADFYGAFTGYDYLNYEAIAAWFRPHRLHPDFDWYLPAVEASPELGAPGGVVPLFGTLEDYRAYVEERYLAHRLPDGVAVVEQEMAFAGVEVSLTDAFSEALEAGDVGACTTADARLPDPDALTWEPYTYALFDAPFDREGAYVREGWNGYDAVGELRVILDPTLILVDMFGSPADNHGTTTAGPIAGRYRPDGLYLGALRGMAPGVKFISYPGDTSDFSFAAAWRRAPDDGVQVLNNSWILFYDFQRRAYGTVTGEELAELGLVAIEQAGAALGRDTLLVISAGNSAAPLDDVRHTYGMITYFDALPHALVVGGTAPRDYHWTGDIPAWLPDAPGQPYDTYRRMQNLDRPMIAYAETGGWIDGTATGRRVDLVAPAGTFYMPDARCGEDPWCWNAGYDDQVWVPDVFDWADWGFGPHIQAMGTSYAAPYATGVAALATQAWVERHGSPPSAVQLKSILMTTADGGVGPTWDEVALADLATDTCALYWERVDKRGPDEWMGAGRLDATGAIERAGQ